MVILESIHASSSDVGSMINDSPNRTVVIEIGKVVIGASFVFPVSTTAPSFISRIGILAVNNAATAAYDVASNKLPSEFIILQSTNMTYTILPGTRTNFSRSIISDSLIPLSTTRANSIVSSSGGPGSINGDAVGRTSAETINAPLFSKPSNGSPVSTFTPATTSVLPSFTQAEPLAFFITST